MNTWVKFSQHVSPLEKFEDSPIEQKKIKGSSKNFTIDNFKSPTTVRLNYVLSKHVPSNFLLNTKADL